VAIGLAVTAYVLGIVGLDGALRAVTGVDLPIVITIALVVTIALFEPVSDLLRRWATGRSDREVAYERLLRALGDPLLAQQDPTHAVEPALARLSRAFRLTGAFLLDPEGRRLEAHGDVDPGSPLALRQPLESGGRSFGEVVFGAKRSGLPYASDEVEVLRLAASYLADTLHLAERQDAQAQALASLSGQRRELAEVRSELHAALVDGGAAAASGLHVFALGPLRVERGGELVRQWGGAKAGTRQAEALFAFLLDRGERGVAKDEILELVWPDVDLERADLAFHRTLGGLRTTLEPGRLGGDRGTAIAFHNDRYRLDPAVVAWSDVASFEESMAAASAGADPDDALRHLERARSLYRGDYLDDCPFYGDSEYVEERRELLRGRFVDLLLALGERYEARGDRPAAAASYRQARMVNGEELPTHRLRDAQSRRHALDSRRTDTGLAQAIEKAIDPLAHDRLQPGPMLRQPQAPAIAHDATRVGQPIEDLHQLGVVQDERRGAPVTGGSSARHGPRGRQDGVQADVRQHRLTAMQPAQPIQQAAFGQPPLHGIHRALLSRRRAVPFRRRRCESRAPPRPTGREVIRRPQPASRRPGCWLARAGWR
jgi:DNA-binding SARP family transcriptional activator